MLGLDQSGKTTLLYQSVMGQTIVTIPTIGFNIEVLKFDDMDLSTEKLDFQQNFEVDSFFLGSPPRANFLDPPTPIPHPYSKMDLSMYDLGGKEKIRPLWQHYFQDTKAIIFVVDSSDKNRFQESKEVF